MALRSSCACDASVARVATPSRETREQLVQHLIRQYGKTPTDREVADGVGSAQRCGDSLPRRGRKVDFPVSLSPAPPSPSYNRHANGESALRKPQLLPQPQRLPSRVSWATDCDVSLWPTECAPPARELPVVLCATTSNTDVDVLPGAQPPPMNTTTADELAHYKRTSIVAERRIGRLVAQVNDLEEERRRDRALIESLTVDYLADRTRRFDALSLCSRSESLRAGPLATSPERKVSSKLTRGEIPEAEGRQAASSSPHWSMVELSQRHYSPTLSRPNTARFVGSPESSAHQPLYDPQSEELKHLEALLKRRYQREIEALQREVDVARQETVAVQQIYEEKLHLMAEQVQKVERSLDEQQQRFERALRLESAFW